MNQRTRNAKIICAFYVQDLEPGTVYWYYVETLGNTSDLFHFTSMPSGVDWSPKMLVYGDMGKEGGSESLPYLYKEASSGDYHAIIHVGDFAYDLDSDGGEVCAVHSLILSLYVEFV